MKILITAIGTRGDMEPMLALGEILKENGHEIICMFPEQFRNLAEASGFSFESLGPEFMEMLESPAGKIAMGGGRFNWKKIKAYKELISIQKPINKKMVARQYEVIENEQPDKIVHNGKVIYPVVWSLKNPGKTVLISPVPYMHYVKDHTHVMFNKNFGAYFNKLTYQLANFGLIKTIMSSLKDLPIRAKIKQRQIQKALFLNDAIYTISPTLFKRPIYWKENIQVLGYHERNKINDWKASEALETFMAKHPKVLLLTFGSMINKAPAQKTEIILGILAKYKIPAIINTASGGLVKPISYNKDLFHFVERIPYDWAFAKMYGVIHHGGSGTTHSAIKYGCANVILPHIIDQYVWNTINHEKGAGPLGIDIDKINTKNLEPIILDLFNNDQYKTKAKELANEMRKEDFRSEVVKAITKT